MDEKEIYLDTLAHILISLGEKEQAIQIEKSAIEKAKKNNNQFIIEEFEKELENFEKNQISQLK